MIFRVTKAGQCANGFERDAGRVVHLVEHPRDDFAEVEFMRYAALCGARPGRRSVGWVEGTGGVICPRCARRANLGVQMSLVLSDRPVTDETARVQSCREAGVSPYRVL